LKPFRVERTEPTGTACVLRNRRAARHEGHVVRSTNAKSSTNQRRCYVTRRRCLHVGAAQQDVRWVWRRCKRANAPRGKRTRVERREPARRHACGITARCAGKRSAMPWRQWPTRRQLRGPPRWCVVPLPRNRATSVVHVLRRKGDQRATGKYTTRLRRKTTRTNRGAQQVSEAAERQQRLNACAAAGGRRR